MLVALWHRSTMGSRVQGVGLPLTQAGLHLPLLKEPNISP
jgi:hypothetical protein